MSPETSATLAWTVVCGSSVTPVSGESVSIPADQTDCTLDVRSSSATPVRWTLTEY